MSFAAANSVGVPSGQELVTLLESSRPWSGSWDAEILTECSPNGAAFQVPIPDRGMETPALGQRVFVHFEAVVESIVVDLPTALS